MYTEKADHNGNICKIVSGKSTELEIYAVLNGTEAAIAHIEDLIGASEEMEMAENIMDKKLVEERNIRRNICQK